ncbi:MAG: class I SAM-dependent methyltransferase [Gammaproteobacteria bacterium]|nr:class I SAM-dependent methyltransferase [Gammaproteobacteria bacterium]
MEDEIIMLNEKLASFWNNALNLSEENKKEILENELRDYADLAPSKKLYNEVKELGKSKKVLDFGCGKGWASIAAAKNGCKDVTAVDLGDNIIDTVNFYKELYGVKDEINAIKIDRNWLMSVPSNTYDGFISSNVLDVIPYETSMEYIKEIARIVTKDAKIIVSMNFYISPELALKKKIELEQGKYFFVNGILRLLSFSDIEWRGIFSHYFDVERIEYFSWPGEDTETRRIFILKKK